MIKSEFNSIELLERNNSWQENTKDSIYVALTNNASIFVIYDHGKHERITFKKENSFRIENDDYLIYDETEVTKTTV